MFIIIEIMRVVYFKNNVTRHIEHKINIFKFIISRLKNKDLNITDK